VEQTSGGELRGCGIIAGMMHTLWTRFTLAVDPWFAPDRLSGSLLRSAVAVAYTALLSVLLLQSSARPLVGPVAPRDFNLVWEILLTLGHLAGFGLLTGICAWAFSALSPYRRSIVIALIFACAFGLVTEALQTLVPDRSVSWFDLLCNWGISVGVAVWLWRRKP
jgi:VanZ family protein